MSSVLGLTSLVPGPTATEHQLEPVRGRAVGQAGSGVELQLKGSQGGGRREEEADKDVKQERIN